MGAMPEDAAADRPPRHDVRHRHRQLPAVLPLAGDVLHGPVRPQPRRALELRSRSGGFYEAAPAGDVPGRGSSAPATARSTSASTSTSTASATRARSRPGWDDWHGGVDPSTYDYYGFTLNHNGRPEDLSAPAALLLDRRLRRPGRARDPRRPPGGQAVLPERRAQRPAHRLRRVARARWRARPRCRRRATPIASPTRRFPHYPNFDEADVSDKPPFLRLVFDRMTPLEIDAAHRPLPRPHGLAAGRRRARRARRAGAAAQRRPRQDGRHLHLGQRLDAGRAPAHRPDVDRRHAPAA